MSPLVKVRLFYALMVFFVVVVIIQMGMFVAHQTLEIFNNAQ